MKLGPHTRIDRYPPIMHMETRSREHACTAEFLLQSIPTICTKINLSGYCYSFAICKKRFIFLLLSGSRWNIIHAAITCLWRRIFYAFLEKVDFVKDFRKWPLKGRCRETCSKFFAYSCRYRSPKNYPKRLLSKILFFKRYELFNKHILKRVLCGHGFTSDVHGGKACIKWCCCAWFCYCLNFC